MEHKELEKQIVYTIFIYIVMFDENKNPYLASLNYNDARKFPNDPIKFKNQLYDACESIVAEYQKMTGRHIVKWKYLKKEAYEKIMKESEMETTTFSFGKDD